MLFHVLSLCVVWSPGHFPGWISSYREAAEDAALQVWSWGWVLTLLHIFLAFLFFEEKTIGGNSGKFGTSVWKNTDSNCLGELIKGNRF